jgi:hypothetical protein
MIPLIPAQAGIQEPQRADSVHVTLGPRFRGDERRNCNALCSA